jgi:hypothetical protein
LNISKEELRKAEEDAAQAEKDVEELLEECKKQRAKYGELPDENLMLTDEIEREKLETKELQEVAHAAEYLLESGWGNVDGLLGLDSEDGRR